MVKYCVFQKQEGLKGEDKCGEGGVGAVEADGAGVGTHDLAGEGEADAGAFGAGGEEGREWGRRYWRCGSRCCRRR